ncbi:MAG TPA: ImmA/IrrE family metallo-endopeptidase [Patescibacteria group bacterium]
MLHNTQEIKKAFHHRLQGGKFMKDIVAKTIQVFPDEMIDHITKHCWFISSFEDGWAFTLKADELRQDEYLIFLSDELLKQDKAQIIYTIVHEIGHVILGHKNAIRIPQSKKEVRNQERQADEFARKYLRS